VNPGGLLIYMRRHLKEDGILVLTTPTFVLRGMLRKTGLDMEVCYYAMRSRKLRRLFSLLRIPSFSWMSMTLIAIATPLSSAEQLAPE
jgi:hypothetical protein